MNDLSTQNRAQKVDVDKTSEHVASKRVSTHVFRVYETMKQF